MGLHCHMPIFPQFPRHFSFDSPLMIISNNSINLMSTSGFGVLKLTMQHSIHSMSRRNLALALLRPVKSSKA